MAIVGTCKNRTPDQLPAWTSNRFDVFLERDPAGLPPNLNGNRKAANSPQGEQTLPRGGNGSPARPVNPGTTDPRTAPLSRRDREERRPLDGLTGRIIFWLS